MTDERASGTIVRARPFRDTSLIVEWLTSEIGLISTLAQGANRPKSPFRGKLDLFLKAEFSFKRRDHGDLHLLKEVELRETRLFLRQDLTALNRAAYASQLTRQVAEAGTPIPGISELFEHFLETLAGKSTPLDVLEFELRLLVELGQQPDLAESKLSPGARKISETLLMGKWRETRLQASAAQVAELRAFLHGFMIYHLGRVPKARAGAFEA
jgi:DNA repair protein RecO (recombination protein O)